MPAQPFLLPEDEPVNLRDEIKKDANIKCILVKYKNNNLPAKEIASEESFNDAASAEKLK